MTTFRFRWTRTWPPEERRPDDWKVTKDQLDHPHDVLRVFKERGGPHGSSWAWGASRIKPKPVAQAGHEDSRDAAALAAEVAYIAAADIGSGPLADDGRL